VNRQKDLKQIS